MWFDAQGPFLFSLQFVVISIRRHSGGAMPKEFGNGLEVATVCKHGRGKKMPDVIQPYRVINSGFFEGCFKRFPALLYATAIFFNDIRGLGNFTFYEESFPEIRCHGHYPVGAGRLGPPYVNGVLVKVHILPE